MNVIEKLSEARKQIREMSVEKKGYNEYSKYKYYTPEQVASMVEETSTNVGLFNKFDLIRSDLGLVATLTIINLQNIEQTIHFTLATEIPSIKATNTAQQLGGCATYSERYLYQIAYGIKDNSQDFDSYIISGGKQNYVYELIRNSTYDDEQKEQMYAKVGSMTNDKYDEAVANLEMNQMDEFDKPVISNKAINKKLDKK